MVKIKWVELSLENKCHVNDLLIFGIMLDKLLQTVYPR